MLLISIKSNANYSVMLEYTLPAIKTAKRLVMKTIWVTKQLKKPNIVIFRLSTLLALTHIRLEFLRIKFF